MSAIMKFPRLEGFAIRFTDAAALTKEITALGYRGSDQTVRRYSQPHHPERPARAGGVITGFGYPAWHCPRWGQGHALRVAYGQP